MIKSLTKEIFKLIQAAFMMRKSKRHQKEIMMMKTYLKIKNNKFYAIYNNEGLSYE